jgi:hypothetical protein
LVAHPAWSVVIWCTLALVENIAPQRAAPAVDYDAASGRVELSTGQIALTVETKAGINARLLRNARTGQVFADADYSWPGGTLPRLTADPQVAQRDEGGLSVLLMGRLGALQVEQRLTMSAMWPDVLLERITIRNPTDAPLSTADFKCGFAKTLCTGETWVPDAADVRFCPVPYRRETNGQMQEFPLREIAEHGTTYAGWMEPAHPTPIWGAEGWVWSKGGASLLLAKYNADSMEWSLMEPEHRGAGTILRFGGAGQWKHGHPEAATHLDPGQAYTFGETCIQVVDGDWQQAYYAYRSYVERKGCRTPPDYNPPVHWNELYDNQYYFKACALCDESLKKYGLARLFGPEFAEQNKKLLDELYSLDLMQREAAKARELGCDVLYLDPGWDIGPNYQIWDAARLGPMDVFVNMLTTTYGLKGVSLWCSLASVPPTLGDPAACPPAARVIRQDGTPDDIMVCLSSPAYLDTKEERLLEVCKNGAVFLMFDSDQFSGPCYDKSHGHPVPSSREDHARALLELTRRVKSKYPHVLIEMHDFITGPSGIHYTPTYYGYARPDSFTCLWGHEFMWNPIDDLLSRRAVSLYYYNLAYSIPFYLHINLKTDNENALVFWWFASTIRHLGVGGQGPEPVWEAQKKAMRQYQALKQFYTQGVFYGLDEMIHAHTLPASGESVLNVFNLDEKPVQRTIKLRVSDIGLLPGSITIDGVPANEDDGQITLDLNVPARGQVLVKIHRDP